MTDERALHCWKCGSAQAQVLLPLSRHEYCRTCGEALHCCRQCVSFDARRPDQCTESRADPPGDRSTANFCEWFAPARIAVEDGSASARAARARLDALFGAPDDGASS